MTAQYCAALHSLTGNPFLLSLLYLCFCEWNGQFQCSVKFLLRHEKQNPSPRLKEHIKNSKCAKFGREMLKNAENIILQNLPILYTFVLQAEIRTTFGVKVVQISTRNTKYTKLANFARLYFPHFSTFCDQISQ